MNPLRRSLTVLLVSLFSLSALALGMQGQKSNAPKAPLKLLVHFKTGAPSRAPFMAKYRLHDLAPLHKEIALQKQRTGKSALSLAQDLRQRFPKRSRRFHGPFSPPDLSKTYEVTLEVSSEAELSLVMDSLRSDSRVDWVAREKIYQAQFTPNDPYYASQGSWGQAGDDLWGIKKIAASGAWDVSTGAGVVVAVVDTGIDYTHPDLAANVWSDPLDGSHGYNYVANTSDPKDDYGHGTFVAGIIAATGNNNVGVIGVAWQSKIMALKGLDSTGSGSSAALAQCIRYAADHGADVINMSWGGSGIDPAIDDALDYAHQLGVVLVASAGNNASDVLQILDQPALAPWVITVSATQSNDTIADFSNYGAKIDVAAPGKDILSLQAAGTTLGASVSPGYVRADGTSASAPFVSGLAALLLAKTPALTNEQVRQILRNSADRLTSGSFDTHFGYGRINAEHALAASAGLETFISAPNYFINLTTLADPVLPISGSADGPSFLGYQLEYNNTTTGSGFQPIGSARTLPVVQGVLGSWDTTSLADGAYDLRLRAWDQEGKTYQFDLAPLYMDRHPPQITLLSPADGASVAGYVPIEVSVSTNTGFPRVDYFVDGSLINSSPYPPYNLTWNTPGYYGLGVHTIQVKAIDAIGGSTASAVHTVTLVRDTTPPTASITSPSPGDIVSGKVPIVVAASDDIGLGYITVWAPTASFNLSIHPPFEAVWDTSKVLNGPATITVTVGDTTGNRVIKTVAVDVQNPLSDHVAVSIGGYSPYVEQGGFTYLKDQAFSGGQTYSSRYIFISNRAEKNLYLSSRRGAFSYALPVRNGDYSVTLKMSDTKPTGPGQDVFDVLAQGVPALQSVDVVAAVGNRAAYDRTFPVHITNQLLTLQFAPTVGEATVSAIVVEPLDQAVPSVPTGLSGALRSAWDITLSWNASTDDQMLGGYWVQVSTSPTFDVSHPGYAMRDAGNVTQFKIEGLSASTSYYARVQSYDVTGKTSGWSEVLTVLTLPAKDILFSDDFNSGTYPQWTIQDQTTVGGPSVWSAASGRMEQTSAIGGPGAGTLALTGDPTWTDQVIRFRCKAAQSGYAGLLFHYLDSSHYYVFEIGTFGGNAGVLLGSSAQGRGGAISAAYGYVVPGQTYDVRIETRGIEIDVYVDNQLMMVGQSLVSPSGRIALYGSKNASMQFDDVLVLAPSINQAPVVYAGADQGLTFGEAAALNGIVTDDGLPFGLLSTTWTVVSAPPEASVIFTSPFSAATQATFSSTGIYRLQLTASDGDQTASSVVSVTVSAIPVPAPPIPPTPDILSFEGKVLTPKDTITFTYSGEATGFSWEFGPGEGSGVTTGFTRSRASSVAGKATAQVSTLAPNLNLSQLTLPSGDYLLRIRVFSGGQWSMWASAHILWVAALDLKEIRVYPNPWRASRGNSTITFDQLSANSTVEVFTTSGRWVQTLLAPAGTAVWDLSNDSGDKVASGLYFYVIRDESGNQARGKLGVIR
jgi:subtilisin family serine protease